MVVDKNMGVLFVPGLAVMFDLEDGDCVLVLKKKNDDGLYYFTENGSKALQPKDGVDIGKYKALNAGLPKFAPSTSN